MKTIEERAREYAPDAFRPDEILPAREGHLVNLERRGFIAGAKSEHDELTRWKNSKCPPNDNRTVLLKISEHIGPKRQFFYFRVGYYLHSEKVYHIADKDYNRPIHNVVGWREIHE